MTSLRELALLFLRLGTTAYGGPAAHIAMMEDEFVRRRNWLSHEYFLDLLGATNLIPGPNSTEMAIHIGFVRAGWKGLLVAGACFILPASAVTLLLAYLYSTYGSIPNVAPFIAGVRPAIIAIVLISVYRLAKPLREKHHLALLSVIVVILNLLGIDEILLLLLAGAAGLAWSARPNITGTVSAISVWMLSTRHEGITPGALASGWDATLPGLGLYFLKIGSVLYGSGYVLIAFLQGGLVDARHWLTQSQLMDAIAVGQFTPGPVLSAATFIGYLILGVPGALVATGGIFLPSFLFVLATTPFIPKIRKWPLAGGFLDGVNAGALGLMFAVSVKLALASMGTPGAWVIFGLAGAASLLMNVNTALIVLVSSVIGWLFAQFHF